MKDITLYLDVWTGLSLEQQSLCATTAPGQKSPDVKRFAINIRLPELYNPDEILPVHEFKEVDKD